MANVSETEGEGEPSHITDSASGTINGPKIAEGRIVRGTRRERARLLVCSICSYYHGYLATAHDIAVYERKNWLIHLHYIRKDFETCKVRTDCIVTCCSPLLVISTVVCCVLLYTGIDRRTVAGDRGDV